MEKWIYGKKPTEVTPAKGVTGIIIDVLGKPYFRVYNKEYKDGFKDYKLCHADLEVTIEDAGASFYEREEDEVCTLDYAPRCFGLIRVKD